MQPFTKQVLQIIQQIPKGKVMTYGQIAQYAGSPRGARQVARILHSMSTKHHLPWHRVVNAQGKIVIKDEETALNQLMQLEAEGVYVKAGMYVDLEKYRFKRDIVPMEEQDRTL
ncbi:MGMT family protein [Virgibacillus sp. W0181]|uniref:MGMT family protein n=1 Tax=Virgibacillus sp. W0181 TaxID=3391581 RepID=UPI003F464A0C